MITTIDSGSSSDPKVGSNITIQESLGRGSYGSVHRCVDETGKVFAVKRCPIKDSGIPNILEASIMTTVMNEYINRALFVHADSDMLYIFQDIAKADMSRHIRKHKNLPSCDKLRVWSYSLVRAVSCLTTQRIIHGDIKAGNVLLYDNDKIRLSDFTLSVKKWKPDDQFTHTVGTITHRPLENLIGKEWDESLDIWSLACTLYEIAYGEVLFPNQDVVEGVDNAKQKDQKDQKVIIRQRMINCLLDWGLHGPKQECHQKLYDLELYPVPYAKFKLSPLFYNKEYSVFNDLILSMLHIIPQKRPNINTVMSHHYFDGFVPETHQVITRLHARNYRPQLERYIDRYASDMQVRTIARHIYLCLGPSKEIADPVRGATCVWIACKLANRTLPKFNAIPPHQLLLAERLICHSLHFRLHTCINN